MMDGPLLPDPKLRRCCLSALFSLSNTTPNTVHGRAQGHDLLRIRVSDSESLGL
jgi:hypothetical protein